MRIVPTKNENEAVTNVEQQSSSSRNIGVGYETVKFVVPQKSAESFLAKGGNGENRVSDVHSLYNLTDEGDDGNETAIVLPTLTVGRWTITECNKNEKAWVCEMTTHLLIPEIGFYDNVTFIVGSEDLKVGASEEDPPSVTPSETTRSTKKPQENPTTNLSSVPPTPVVRLRIILECPAAARCEEGEKKTCSGSEMYFHSFWLGLAVGVIIGMIVVALFTTCVSAVVSKKNNNQRSA